MKRFIVFCLILLLSATYVKASQPDVVLNEVLIEPQQSVELYNDGDTDADISGWSIDDAGGSTYFTIPSGTVLPPHHCVVFTSSFSFNKSTADTARLFDASAAPTDPTATPVDSYSYTSSHGSGTSFQRIPDAQPLWSTAPASLGVRNLDSIDCLPQISVTPAPAITLAPQPDPSQVSIIRNVYITEAAVNPMSGSSEWVEIFNNNEYDVTLDGWYIDDILSGGGQKIEFSRSIPSQSYTIIDIPSALFNNSSDEINLLNSDGETVDSVAYSASVKGMSVGKTTLTDVSACVMQPTQALPNTTCVETVIPPIPTPTIKSEIKKEVISATPRPAVPAPLTSPQRTPAPHMKSQSAIQPDSHTPQKIELESTDHVPADFARTLSFSSLSASILTIISLAFKIRGE